jgi:8-oxo-dGTP pyrophosphatase MutT (NUDIX family)
MLSFLSLVQNVAPAERKSSGCCFTDGNLYLAGYQPNKKTPSINGIGGHIEEGETELQAAIRETIEELFEIHPVPPTVLKEIRTNIPPREVHTNHSYTIHVYTFEDLEHMLRRIQAYNLQSKVYQKFPTSIGDLVFKRNISNCRKAEITHLAVLPFVDHPKENPLISPYLLSDIRFLKKSKSTGKSQINPYL